MSLSRVPENYISNNLSVAEQKPNTGLQPTEIGAIPEEWEFCSLKEVAEITRLAGAEYTEFWEIDKEGDIISLRGQNIGENQLFLENCDRISASLSQKLIRSKLFKDDIVFPCVGSIGKAAIIPVDDKFHINQNIAKLRAKTKLYPLYLLFFLLSDITKKQIIKHNTASSQPSVLVGSLRDFLIPVPSLHEQKQIAEIIRSVYEAIASTQAVIDQARKVKQGLLQQLLTRGIGHTKFKESAIGKIPETWKVVAFENLAQIGPQNGIYKSKDDYGSGTPMIDMGDIFKLDVIDEAERRCVRLTEEEQEKFTLQYGDLLFARRSLVAEGSGKCSMVGHHSIRPVFESSIIRFRLKSNICNSLFYFYYWESPIGKKLRRGITRQVAVSGVTGKDLEKLPIALPPLDEQVEITSILKSLDEDIASHEAAITQLNSIKRGLMQDLLTGKVRVGCTS